MAVLSTPYAFQDEDAERMEERFGGRVLVAWEMGLGKSLLSFLYRERHTPTARTVVVCPASLKVNWQREILRHTGRRSEILETRKTFPLHRIPLEVPIILNYDILKAWLDRLKDYRLGPELVILDECHLLKSRGAQRTKAARVLCQDVPHVLALSGTPMTNRPAELWPVLNILQPSLFPSFFTYANRYCKPEYTPWGVKYTGACRLEELHRQLNRTCMIRRRKADVLKDLPPMTRQVIPLPLSDPAQYEMAEKDFSRWLADTYPDRASNDRRSHRLVQMGYLKRLAGTLKLKAVKEWIDSFAEEAGKKLIVFGVHQAVLHDLHDHYRDSVLVDGGVTGNKRQLAFDRFLNRRDCTRFFGNVQAAGTGWSAKGCDTVAFCELDWVPGNHTQAEARVHGIGRGSEGVRSMAYYLISEDTIEMDLCEVLQEKQRTLDLALDGRITPEGLNVLDLVEERMLARRERKAKGRKK
jgi:SWI/SNF-related matrix-associated actin-dependent regulator 1 of chromatin subfamily A